jgi:dTDP-4-amino-4,6-dideoxygalactose transaminase
MYRGKRAGVLGHAAAFSFYPTKNLGAYGEAGALTTDDDQVAKFVRAARNHGQTMRYEHEFVGYNYRMEGFQGAILRIKLRRLYAWTAKRQAIAREYRRLLAGLPVEIPVDDPRDECVYHQFVVYSRNRNSLVSQLSRREIETVVHYPKPVHLQPAYSALGYPPGTFPKAERACERVFSLPIYPYMTAEQVAYVGSSVREVVEEQAVSL